MASKIFSSCQSRPMLKSVPQIYYFRNDKHFVSADLQFDKTQKKDREKKKFTNFLDWDLWGVLDLEIGMVMIDSPIEINRFEL